MTPARTGKGKGRYEFDRVFPDVGRVRRSSGTNNLREFHRRDAILTKLYETSQLELLREFKAGRVSIETLVEADRHSRGGETLELLKLRDNLWDTVKGTLPQMGRAKGTRDRYAHSFKQLRARCPFLGPAATVADLRRVKWAELHAAWPGTPADWNRLRSAVSALLTKVTGDKYSPFRRAVVAMMTKQKEPEGRTPDLTPAQFVDLLQRIPDQDVRDALALIVITGLRVGEYLSLDRRCLQPGHTRIRVPEQEGNKTGSRLVPLDPADWHYATAAVPFAGLPVPRPAIEPEKDPRYRRMWKHWRTAQRAAGRVDEHNRAEIWIHDLRHCAGQWASDAGNADRAVQELLGQKDPRMAARYTRQKDARSASRAVGAALKIVGG